MAGRFSVETVFAAVDKMTAPVKRMQNSVTKLTTSVETGLRRANRSLDTFTRGIGRGGVTAMKFGAAGIGVLTAAVTYFTHEFSKIENAEAAFTPLLGGAKRAKDMVDALNNTAATTPFQFETLAGAANQLLPVMNGNIEDTIKTVRMLGDTAGGNAQKLDSITRGFTKAMLKGKVDMESLNMIAEAGVPIFGDLASVMGTDVNESFFKMISAGKVTTQQLTKAFEKMTSKGGKFFNGMDIASRTTSGMWSTLMDNISLTAAEIGSVLSPVIKDLIKDATGIAQRVREWVKNNKELISVKFLAFVEKAKSAVSGLIESISAVSQENDVLSRLGDIIVGISNAFRFLGEHGATIAKIIAGIVALSLVLKTFIAVMTAVNLVMALNPIGLMVLGIAALIAGFTALVVWIDDIAAGFDSLPGIIQAILYPIGLLIDAIKFVKDNWSSITNAASAVGDFFGFGSSPVPVPVKAITEAPRVVSTAEGVIGKRMGEDQKTQESATPQVISPQDRVATSIEEKRQTSTAEVTIKDGTGRAEVTGGKLGSGVKLQSTGAF